MVSKWQGAAVAAAMAAGFLGAGVEEAQAAGFSYNLSFSTLAVVDTIFASGNYSQKRNVYTNFTISFLYNSLNFVAYDGIGHNYYPEFPEVNTSIQTSGGFSTLSANFDSSGLAKPIFSGSLYPGGPDVGHYYDGEAYELFQDISLSLTIPTPSHTGSEAIDPSLIQVDSDFLVLRFFDDITTPGPDSQLFITSANLDVVPVPIPLSAWLFAFSIGILWFMRQPPFHLVPLIQECREPYC